MFVSFDIMLVGISVVCRCVCTCGYCVEMVALCNVWCEVTYIVDLLNGFFFEKGVSIRNVKGASVRWTTFEVRRWLPGSITRLSAWGFMVRRAYSAVNYRVH
jgi:hypothetical protein